MKKVMNFCKLYLSEILFAVTVLPCCSIAMFSIFYLPQVVAIGLTVFATITLAVSGYFFQKLEKAISQPSLVFTVVWCAGFVLLMLVIIVSTIIVCSSAEKIPFYILLIVCGILFVAMFGYLVIVSDIPPQENHPPTA